MKIHKYIRKSARIFMGKRRKFAKQARYLTALLFSALVESTKEMLKKIALITAFFTLTPSLIIAAGIFLTFDNKSVNLPPVSTAVEASSEQISNNIEGNVIGTEIAVDDIRAIKVAKFLKGTPLAPYSDYMVHVSDKYGLDYRLIPAISMKESGGGAAVDPASHNAWGFENGSTYFPSWEYAIDRVGKTMYNGYISKGLITPDQIMPKYAPPQVTTGGKWAIDVNHFYEEIESQ